MGSFEGTVWDPVLRRWEKPTIETTERLGRPGKVPRKAIDVPAAPHSDEIPDDSNFIIRPRARKAIEELRSAAEQLMSRSARTNKEALADYKSFEDAVLKAVEVGAKDHPIVQKWLNGQQSVGLNQLDMADFWIVVTAYDPIEEEKKRIEEEHKRHEPESKRPTSFQFNRVHHKLWEALASPGFPGPLFVRLDQAEVLDSQAELQLWRRFREQRGMSKKLFEHLQTMKSFERKSRFQRISGGV